jgi:hypothetical protein
VGLFDLLLLLAQIAIPGFLAIVAIVDWRAFSRARYLVLLALYAFFALAIGIDYYSSGSDPLVCVGSYFWILIAAFLHMRWRRLDRAKQETPPMT